MTVNDVFELRSQGRTEAAYEAARVIHATDKSPHASVAMFWTAVDILRLRVSEGYLDEAERLFAALNRLVSTVPDKDGWVVDLCGSVTKFGKVEDLWLDHDERGGWIITSNGKQLTNIMMTK